MVHTPKADFTALHRINTNALGLASLATLGLLLRLRQINGAVWYDEAFSIWLAKLPVDRLLAATLGDVHPPAYYLLLNGLSYFSPAEAGPFWFRLPSLIAGMSLIIVTYRLAIALDLPPAARWLATGLITVSPFQLYYSNEVRSYALLSLFVALAALGLVERRLWLAIFGSLAALYLHNMAALFIAALWGGALFLDIGLKKLLVTGGLIAFGFLPGIINVIYQAAAVKSGFWVPPIAHPVGRLILVIDNLLFLTPHNPFGTATALVTALSLVIIGLAGPRLITSPAGRTLLVWAAAPLLLAIIVSLLFQPVMVTRTMAPAAPFYCLLLAWAVTQTPRRAAVWFAVTGPVTAAIVLAILLNQIGRPVVDGGYLNLYGHYRPGDAVFHTSMGSFLPWQFYRPYTLQYVRASEGSLVNDLTPDTKAAMGIPQHLFEEVLCQAPRWWVIQFDNPTSSPQEMAYVQELITRYKPTQTAILQDDTTVTARLYLVKTAPYCLR